MVGQIFLSHGGTPILAAADAHSMMQMIRIDNKTLHLTAAASVSLGVGGFGSPLSQVYSGVRRRSLQRTTTCQSCSIRSFVRLNCRFMKFGFFVTRTSGLPKVAV